VLLAAELDVVRPGTSVKGDLHGRCHSTVAAVDSGWRRCGEKLRQQEENSMYVLALLVERFGKGQVQMHKECIDPRW